MGEILVRLSEKDIYPLIDIVKIKKGEIAEEIPSILRSWAKKEAISLYSQGKISSWKAADMLGISLWEMIDLLKDKNIPIQMGKVGDVSG
jgi:predicted HTH domain antitoxin